MKWSDLLSDLEVVEVFPLNEFSVALDKYLKAVPKKPVEEIDFTGLDVLTDEALLVLVEAFNETALAKEVKSIKCTGCIHISDFGIIQLTKVFSNLEKVYFDGCPLVSEVAVHQLVRVCPDFTEVSLCGTNVAFVPQQSNISFVLHGCPLIPAASEGASSESQAQDRGKLLPKKLVIMSKSKCPFSLLDWLTSGSLGKQEMTKREDNGRISMAAQMATNKQVPFVDSPLNIMELYCKPAFYSPFLSDGALHVIVVPLTSLTNIHYHIVTRLNMIRGSVAFAELIVVILHDTTEQGRISQELSQMGKELQDYIDQQYKVLSTHVKEEKHSYRIPDEPHRRFIDRDFQTQQRFSRSVRVLATQTFKLKLFGICTTTSEVRLFFPAKSNATAGKIDENSLAMKELNNLMETKMMPAHRRLKNLNKSDLSEVKSISRPPQVLLKALTTMTILFNEKEGWDSIKRMLSDYKLVSNMINYDLDSLTPAILRKLEPFISDEDLTVDKVMRVSNAAAAVYAWAEAVYHCGRAKQDCLTVIMDDEEDDSSETGASLEDAQTILDTKLTPALNSITKKDISLIKQLKNLKKPPASIMKSASAFCVLFKKKETWSSFLEMMSNVNIMQMIVSYDKDNIPPQILDRLQTILDDKDLSTENIQKACVALVPIHCLTEALYLYGRALETARYFKQGPRVLLKAINSAIKTQEKACSFYLDAPPDKLAFVEAVYKKLQEVRSVRLLSEEDVFTTLRASGQYNGLDRRSLLRILEVLNNKGYIIYIKCQDDSNLVVLDIDWFIQLLPPLQAQNQSATLANKARYKALPPDTPVLTTEALAGIWGESCTPKQLTLVVRALASWGIIMALPMRSVEQQVRGQGSFVLYSHLFDRVFALQSAEENAEAAGGIWKYIWPEDKTEFGTSDTDIRIDYRYQFAAGLAPSLIPRLFSTCSAMGKVVMMWRWGVLVRVGAAEVLIKHNISSVLLSSNIDVEGRVTRWDDPSIDQTVIQEYLWGAVSPYLLLIENLINQYHHVHCKIQIPCRGAGCIEMGVPRNFSPAHFSRELNWSIQCATCKGKSMTVAESNLLTGKQRFLAFHDYRDYDGVSHNKVAPYAGQVQAFINSHDVNLLWACAYCGITQQASRHIWNMESELFPCPAMGVIATRLSHKEGLSVEGSVISALPLKKRPEGEKAVSFVVMRSRLLRTGTTSFSITVLQPGAIKIAIAQESLYESLGDDGNLDDADFYYDLTAGVIQTVDFSKSTFMDRVKVKEQRDEWRCGVGDCVTVHGYGETLVNYSDDMVKLNIAISVLKNGHPLLESVTVTFRTSLALCLKQTKDSLPSVMMQAPKFPVVRGAHFPLGSLLLVKSIGNQWVLAKILAIKDGFLYVGNSEDELETSQLQRFHTASQDIRPVGNYTEDFPIVVQKGNKRELIQYKADLMKAIHSFKSCPAPLGLFYLSLPDGNTFQPMVLGKKRQLARFCTVPWNSPSVVQEAHRKFMNTEAKMMKTKNDIWFSLLPSDLTARDLLNPCRQRQQDWKKQDLHLICKGNEWSMKDDTSYIRDAHFLNIAPIAVNSVQCFSLIQSMLPTLLASCACLEQGRSILPQTKCMFPQLEGDMPEDELLEGIWQFVDLYLQSFLLLERSITKTPKANEMLLRQLGYDVGMGCGLYRAPLKSSSKVKMSKVSQNPEEDTPFAPFGRCFTHGIPAGIFIQSLLSDNPEQDEEKKLQEEYMTCVTHVTTARSAIHSKMATLLQKLPHLEAMSLFRCSIQTLDGMESCPYMTHLMLQGNKIPSIPASFVALKDTLETLQLGQNLITEIPSFITSFQRLKVLSVRDSTISTLPENIGEMKNLVVLNLKSSLISKLPSSIRNLTNLEVLVLEGVPVIRKDSLLDISGDLVLRRENLKQMNLMNNNTAYRAISHEDMEAMFDSVDTAKQGILLEEGIDKLKQTLFDKFPRIGQDFEENDPFGGFPPEIFHLRRLRVLSIGYQAVRFVPDAIQQLSRLTTLLLPHSPHLHSLGNGLGKCPLKVLNLDDCDMLRTPPREIREQGMKVVISYVKRLAQGSTACYRTKLMFLGLGGAGKTSLMRAVMSRDGKAPHLKGEGITDGIDISNWSVNRNGTTITYSVWDFAGQTVYYNTHQFFLSNRAVYMLVWNTRLGYEHSGLDFWLSSISCHCPKVPIFVIGTHADQITNPELPESDMRKRFPNIHGFFTVSSVEGQGIPELLEELLQVTMEQPYIGEKVPEAWLNLEKQLLSKRKEKSLVEFSVIEKLGENSGIYANELTQAVQFLHELGTLQHFNNELLKDRVVINPQWIVDVMACVVSVHNKVVKDGYMKHSDIGKIWKDYPKELHDWMLRLTEVFDLTFPLSDRPENVVPCLLTQTMPQFEWPGIEEHDGARESKMVYTFDYLPAGLFNRAQVRLYQYCDSSSLWKNGSVLKKNNHSALMQQTGTRELLVRVYGLQPENILLLIHEVFESLIHEAFSGVKYEYQLPCMDCLKSSLPEPAMFPSGVLRRAIELKALFLQCHSAFHTLSITDVQSVMPPQSVSDYDLQLQSAVQDLEEMREELSMDAAFLYCPANAPTDDAAIIHPKQIVSDLEQSGFKCWFDKQLCNMKMEDIAVALKSSKMVCVLVSDDFVLDGHCQRMFQFAKDSLRKEILLLMVGQGKEWMKSDIGMQMSHKVFINFQRVPHYQEKMKELVAQLGKKSQRGSERSRDTFDVFLSYCWSNSATAVKVGTRPKQGSIGHGDPRTLKQFLESQGLKCWIDIENAGKSGLFEDIAQGMKRSRVIVACISDEYASSSNCQMEFRFAHVALGKPIILAVVGTGFKWESTEVGMLSLGYPKINFQVANDLAHDQLIETIKEHVASKSIEDVSPVKKQTDGKAFQELYEMAQRKFLRQISAYVEHTEPYPRLFVADLKSKDDDSKGGDEDQDEAVTKDAAEATEDDRQSMTFVYDDLQAGQFCIKSLCEYEGGWHCVDEGVTVDLSGPDLVTLWECAAPYMARILAILKHSNINLHIINTPEGAKMMHFAERKAGLGGASHLKQIYLLIRKYVCAKDLQEIKGGLRRCYIPSGKVLWLCEEHQAMPRVSVVDSPDISSDMMYSEDTITQSSMPEKRLLKGLMKIANLDLDSEDKRGKDEEGSTQSEPSTQTPACDKAPDGEKQTLIENDSESVTVPQNDTIMVEDIKTENNISSESILTNDDRKPKQNKLPSDSSAQSPANERKSSRDEPVRRLSGLERMKIVNRLSAQALTGGDSLGKAGPTSRACTIL